MPDTITGLPEQLQADLEQAARAQERPVSAVLADAVTAYLDERSWQKLIQAGRGRAGNLGLTEKDVPRLVTESRAEQRRER